MINQIPNLLGTRKSYKRLNECPEQSFAFEKVFIPGVTRMTGLPCDEEVLHNMFQFISHLNKNNIWHTNLYNCDQTILQLTLFR